ncbi:MAG: insulinase family protein [Clostridia bacterium]|nr:insulinase family protein [Clostridia bacterium]
MQPILEKDLAPGVRLRGFCDPRFKTMRLSVHMVVPLKKETAALYALLPAVMSRVCREYPDYTLMSRYLCDLYGASLTTGVRRLGDCQVLSLHVSSIADRYALDGQRISVQLADLLLSVLFDPYFENGVFPEESVRQEKRQMLELLESEFNDKHAYVRRRCEALLFSEEPAGVRRTGEAEELKAVTAEQLKNAWQELMKTAAFEIFVLGDCDADAIGSVFAARFSKERQSMELTNVVCAAREEVQRVEEQFPVEQSKVVMGFRLANARKQQDAARVMIALFGGSPSSKLFLNVREKQSLCYYCGARADLLKEAVFVESGVDTDKVEQLQAAVLEQLQAVQCGDFTDDDVLKAKLALANSCRTVRDYLGATENWYLAQLFADEVRTPEADVERLLNVTKEEIIQAARCVVPDTVYVLKGRGKA